MIHYVVLKGNKWIQVGCSSQFLYLIRIKSSLYQQVDENFYYRLLVFLGLLNFYMENIRIIYIGLLYLHVCSKQFFLYIFRRDGFNSISEAVGVDVKL